ncbi:hypothetical protein J6590_095066, partial [Homalodisca vitripennis]
VQNYDPQHIPSYGRLSRLFGILSVNETCGHEYGFVAGHSSNMQHEPVADRLPYGTKANQEQRHGQCAPAGVGRRAGAGESGGP